MKLQNELTEFAEHYDLSSAQIESFETYVQLLLSWNKRTNLISRNDTHRIVERHLFESLVFLSSPALQAEKLRLLDVGTGAGLPGIPLAIVRPQWAFVLLDSRKIKTLFLRDVVNQLRLELVAVVCERAESYQSPHLFDVVTARAVARLPKLLDYALPVLEKNGALVALKGGDLNDELALAKTEYGVAVEADVVSEKDDRVLLTVRQVSGEDVE